MTDPKNTLPSALAGGSYRTSDQRHLAQHYGRDRTSAQLAQDLGRTPGAIRKFVERHPELRPPKV